MRRRPLCVALILWIVVILFGYGEEECPKERQGEETTVTCQVEKITGEDKSPTLQVCDVYEGKQPIASRVILYSSDEKTHFSRLRIGNVIRVHCSLYSFERPGNPGQFDEFRYYNEQGIEYKAFVDQVTILDSGYHFLQEKLRTIRRQCYEAICRCSNDDDAGIMAAMLLGEKTGLSKDKKRLYKENGISHILAISGLHVSLLGAGVFFMLRRFVMPMHMAAIITMLLLVAYGILTGFSVSTMRAVIMMICMLGARFLGKRYDGLSALAFSALIQLMMQPLVLYNSGFLLSYGTVFGILVFVKQWEKLVPNNPYWWQMIAGSAGIQMVTLPIILFFYYEIPLYGVVANIIVLPLLGIVLISTIGSIAASAISLLVGRFCFGMVHYILLLYEWVCKFLETLPSHQIIIGCPAMWQIVLYYMILAGWLYVSKKTDRKIHHLLLPLAIVVLCLLPTHKAEHLQVTNLDVGQGDCTCIRAESQTMLVDGGSSDVEEVGKYRIVPFLKHNGIRRIDAIFITHSDGDHTSGLLEILTDETNFGLDIGCVVLPRIDKMDEGYKQIQKVCETHDIILQYMERGESLTIGNLKMECKHPYPNYEWESENDYSLVLEMEYGEFRGLLTGDLEEAGEQTIQSQCKPVTYLKVAHHGSKSSSSESFLQKIRPKIAVYSAGKNNRYGHPAEQTRKRMQALEVKGYATMTDGAVTIVTDGNKVRIAPYRNGG